MASNHHPTSGNGTNWPFADYFWIAGLDGQELLDAYRRLTVHLDAHSSYDSPTERSPTSPLQEDILAEEDETSSILESPIIETPRPRPDSYQRLSKLSNEARRSIQSIDTIAKLQSNRSSVTIKQATSPISHSPGLRLSTVLTDADFDRALQRFASDRDSFFINLDFRNENSKVVPAKSKPKTQKIVGEELDTIPNRAVGSVRRHMSFRDMNSVKRQPSSAARRASTRSSRRISTYNAVIPQPEHLQAMPNEHPLKKRFEPVLLDRYPRPHMTDELNRRNPFPDYVPMFAFPNDIQVVSSDTRPPTTWHGFSMTAADNSKVPAVCIIVWVPMSRQTADELEKLCEEWRKANLSDAEREMAASLAERVAIERAKLSRLLSKLPQVAQGSSEREVLEEDIGAVEEKINLMSDMLRPLRHGAANRIEGLTDGDTGLWIPRAYGLLGKEHSITAVWKEWLKAVVVPMMEGRVLRVPPSSPKVGMWQPIERYVHNICCEAQTPTSSRVQIELAVRDLKLFAKCEADNELPGSRNTELYPLFRALTISNILVLFEYLLTEARIILASAHPAMLKLVSKALVELLWPFEWAGVYIPVLPARLMQVLEAPCPYLCGIVRKGDQLDLPEDDFVLVDLDKNEIHATEMPTSIPRQKRRKLLSMLHLAAPHHHSRGVPIGPPVTAMQAFPHDAFPSEQPSLFSAIVPSTDLPLLAVLSGSMFGRQAATSHIQRPPVLNAFMQFGTAGKETDPPTTASTFRRPSQQGSDMASPVTANFSINPPTFLSRNDSGYALQTSLREKRSGHFGSLSNNEALTGLRRKASLPFVRHVSNPSIFSVGPFSEDSKAYAASSYASSTLAASTVMPGVFVQPAFNTQNQIWVEGHCLHRQTPSARNSCSVCLEAIETTHYTCSDCGLLAHAQCTSQISIVCQAAFFPEQVRAAFARFFTSLLYPYKKFAKSANPQQLRAGIACKINVDAWTRSLSSDHATYIEALKQTQAFNEFIAEREHSATSASNSVRLFDALIAAKRDRLKRLRPAMESFGIRSNAFYKSSVSGSGNGGGPTDFLNDLSSHVWKVVSFVPKSSRPEIGKTVKGRDYRAMISRAPAKLEDELLFVVPSQVEPSVESVAGAIGGQKAARLKRMMNGLSMNAP